MVDNVIRAGIAYSFYAVPYFLPTIKKLDKKFIGIQKAICGLPKCTANIIIQLPHDLFGLEAFSLKKYIPKMYQRTTQKRIKRPRKIRNNIQTTHTTHISQIRGSRGHTKNQISRLYQITYDTNTISYENGRWSPSQKH
jgi:hypothetical protein